MEVIEPPMKLQLFAYNMFISELYLRWSVEFEKFGKSQRSCVTVSSLSAELRRWKEFHIICTELRLNLFHPTKRFFQDFSKMKVQIKIPKLELSF